MGEKDLIITSELASVVDAIKFIINERKADGTIVGRIYGFCDQL